jgi:conjugative relaxase-like TrwC/TraI family protein
MLSIGVLQSSAQAGTYYAQDNYYTKGSEAGDGVGGPALWDGKGAKGLGLTGAVEQGQFERLLNGELPNGVVLKRGQQGKHQPGWDLTFSAPKSVSLLALVAGDSRAVEAHNLAVSEALRYLETTTALARIKQEGKSAIEARPTDHRALYPRHQPRARPPAPHPCCGDQRHAARRRRVASASSKEMFRAKMVGGAIYRAELARRYSASAMRSR